MNKKDAEKTILKLRKEIEHHNRKYYQDAKPEISDYEFDKMMERKDGSLFFFLPF